MFKNIGKKIRVLAIVRFWLYALGSFISGIVILAEDEWLDLGLPLLLAGPVYALIVSWLIYGFGQLIENTDKIANKMNNETVVPKVKSNPAFKESVKEPAKVKQASSAPVYQEDKDEYEDEYDF